MQVTRFHRDSREDLAKLKSQKAEGSRAEGSIRRSETDRFAMERRRLRQGTEVVRCGKCGTREARLAESDRAESNRALDAVTT